MALLARRGLRLAGWISGGLLLLLILAIVVLHTAPVRRYAEQQASAILRRQGIDMEVSGLSYNLLKLSGSVNSIRVQSTREPSFPPLLTADRVDVDLSLRKLIQGEFAIEDASVTNPNLHIVIDEAGRDNIPRDPNPSAGGATAALFIDHLLIAGGTFEYEDRRRKLDVRVPLDRTEIDGDSRSGTHHITFASVMGGTARFDGRMLPLGRIRADAQLLDDAVTIRNLTLPAGDSELSASGRVDNFNDPRFDLKGASTLALAPLLQFGGVPRGASGTVNATWTVSGPMAGLNATARLSGAGLTLDRFRGVSVQAEAAYDAGKSRARFESINLRSLLGTIQGKADVALTQAAGTSTANLTTRRLDLDAAMASFGQPIRIASRADAEISAHWPGLEFQKFVGDATVQLTPERQDAAKDLVPVAGRLSIKTGGRRTVVRIAELRALDAEFNGEVVLLNRQQLSGTLRATAGNIGATVGQAEAALGRPPGSLLGTPVSGGAAIVATLAGTLDRPSIQAGIEAPSLQAGTLKNISLQAEAAYDPSQVRLDRLSVSWQNQTITASGTIGATGQEHTLNLQARAQSISIAQVLAGLNQPEVPVDGTASFQADLTGTMENPLARFQLTGENVTAYQELFGQLTLRGGVDGRVVRIEDLLLDKPQQGGAGRVQGTGSYDLDTRDYSLDLTATGLSLTRLTLPDGSPVRTSGARVEAKGQGNLDDPALNLAVTADAVRYRDQDLGSMEAGADVASKQANLRFNAPKFSLAGKALLGTASPYAGTFEIEARNTQLDTLPLPPTVPLTGTVTAIVKGSGNIENYTQGEVTAEIAAANIQWKGQPIATEGPLRASYSGEVLTVEQATIVALNSRLTLAGSIPLTAQAGTGAVQVSATLDLPTLESYLTLAQPVMAAGTAMIEGEIRGNLQRIDPELKIELRDGGFTPPGLNTPLTNAQLRGEVRDGALQLDSASAKFGPASITASGVFPFALLPELPVELPRKQGPAQFTADLQSLDLATLGVLPADVRGVVSARLEATAPGADVSALTATLTLPELRLGVGSYNVAQKTPSRILIRNGVATVDEFALGGPLTDLRLSGSAGLTGEYPLDFQLNGTADASLASMFTKAAKASGSVTVQAAVTGTAKEPAARGFIELAEGQVAISNPLIAAENLNARLELAGKQVQLTRLDGSLNGGKLAGSGTLGYQDGRLANTNLKVKAEGVYFNFPEGLKTISNVDLTLQSAGPIATLAGQVVIEEGGFTNDLNLDSGILGALTAPASIDLTEERNRLLDSLRFNVHIDTANPIVVKNNLAKVELTTDLRVMGTPFEPGLSGRLTIAENGQIRLQERDYQVERGIITFNNERRIEPELDVIATTQVAAFDIRLQVQGRPGKTETTLTSNPSLPEPDLIALLITGKRRDQLEGQEVNVARDQVLSYLAGRAGSTLGRGIQSATGLSMVRIEPNLIAPEADPSARLTVGQNITRQLEVIYSMDLVDSSDQIYITNYNLTRRFTTRGVRQSDGSFRFDFRHDLRFGGLPEPRLGKQQNQARIGDLALTGNPGFPQAQILDMTKLKSGDKYDYFKARKGVDRVNRLYTDKSFLEAKIRLRREQDGGKVNLNLNVNHGPKVTLVFEGVSAPGSLQDRVRELWFAGVFDTQRAEEAKGAIREWLAGDHYLQSQIAYTITAIDPETKRVVFDITPGPKFNDVEWEFLGASGEEPSTLRRMINQQGLAKEVYTKPERVTELLVRYYQGIGYLDAAVSNPRYELDAATRTGKVVFPVSEGPLYRIGDVRFEGNTVISDAVLNEEVPLPHGEAFRPVLRATAVERLKALYWRRGYNDVDAQFLTQRRASEGTVNVVLHIDEGRRSVVREVLVEGNDKTSDQMIRSQLVIGPGDPLRLDRVGASRRNLYRTGAYSLVDIVNEPIVPAAGGAPQLGEDTAVRLRVQVREVQPYELLYGAFYDTERGAGVIADVSNRNSLGAARVLGFRGRYDSQVHEARLYFSQPLLRRFPLETIITPFLRQERNPATKDTDPFNVDRNGFSIQQEARLRQKFLWNYGYRIEQSRTYDPGPDAFFDVSLRIASLTGTLSRETRDDILDSTRGSFTSHAVQFSVPTLGSELSFAKYFGQYFRYFALQKPRVELFTNAVRRPRLVYATGIRVGLAKGFSGQEVPLSERFFAGGSNTIRGFQQNTVGPILGRQPLGGQAMFVLNNELRVPLFSIFDGVGFVDIGNVYSKVTDFRFTDLRKTGGLGVRVRTPWFLLRLDYGMKLDRREGESLGRVFFSIGQAF